MKMQFSFTLQGNGDLETRFLEKLKKIPSLQMNIIHGFGNLMAMALDATPDDNLSIVAFRGGRVEEKPEEAPSENIEKQKETN